MIAAAVVVLSVEHLHVDHLLVPNLADKALVLGATEANVPRHPIIVVALVRHPGVADVSVTVTLLNRALAGAPGVPIIVTCIGGRWRLQRKDHPCEADHCGSG